MRLIISALRTASVAASHVISTLMPRNSIKFIVILVGHVEGED
jgi:hypothetical protein